MKEEIASAFVTAEVEPDPADPYFRFIFQEVGLTAPDAYGVAQSILNMGHLYRIFFGPEIERIRLVSRKKITEAETVEAITFELEMAQAELDHLMQMS